MKYEKITEKIIGWAMRVHTHFGPGFPEFIYRRSLIIEINDAGLDCLQEISKEVYYKKDLVGIRRLDIIVENVVLCELKAISELDKSSYNQILNYMKVFNIQVGLLFNFGEERLIFKRFVFDQ